MRRMLYLIWCGEGNAIKNGLWKNPKIRVYNKLCKVKKEPLIPKGYKCPPLEEVPGRVEEVNHEFLVRCQFFLPLAFNDLPKEDI